MPFTENIIEQMLLRVLTKTSIQLISRANIAQLQIESFLATQGVAMSTEQIQALIFGGESTVAKSALDTFRNIALRIITGAVNDAWGVGTELRQVEDAPTGKLYTWRVESANPCPDCSSRNGQRLTLPEWQAAGLPRSGFSVCGTNCKCTLDSKAEGPLNYSRSKGKT